LHASFGLQVGQTYCLKLNGKRVANGTAQASCMLLFVVHRSATEKGLMRMAEEVNLFAS
jgi:hypothetical protein